MMSRLDTRIPHNSIIRETLEAVLESEEQLRTLGAHTIIQRDEPVLMSGEVYRNPHHITLKYRRIPGLEADSFIAEEPGKPNRLVLGIRNIQVPAERRGKGIGIHLVQVFEDTAYRLEIADVEIHEHDYAFSEHARAFFGNRGYAVIQPQSAVAASPVFADGVWIMRKRLATGPDAIHTKRSLPKSGSPRYACGQ